MCGPEERFDCEPFCFDLVCLNNNNNNKLYLHDYKLYTCLLQKHKTNWKKKNNSNDNNAKLQMKIMKLLW